MIADAHEGLTAAMAQVFSAPWQRGRVHFMRHLLACVPKASQSLVGTLVRQVFVQPAAASAQCPGLREPDKLPRIQNLFEWAG